MTDRFGPGKPPMDAERVASWTIQGHVRAYPSGVSDWCLLAFFSRKDAKQRQGAPREEELGATAPLAFRRSSRVSTDASVSREIRMAPNSARTHSLRPWRLLAILASLRI